MMDPFVVLGAAAVVTKTLPLGTGICLIAQRDPIQTARSRAAVSCSASVMAGTRTRWPPRHRFRERVKNVVRLLVGDPNRQSVQRIVLAALRSEVIAATSWRASVSRP